MVSIIKYSLKCKDTLGGLKKIYLFPFVKYNRFQIEVQYMNLITFPNTGITPFECIGSYTQSSDYEGGEAFFNQSISIQLNKVYGILDVQTLLKSDYRIILQTNNDDLLIAGTRNGLKATTNNNSGTSKSEFNGFKLDFTGKEENPLLLISNLQDVGFFINENGFNYLLNLGL